MEIKYHSCNELKYTIRSNVTLLPCVSIKNIKNSASGFIGAYESEKPIPEALRLTMNCQTYLFLPYQEAEQYFNKTVIYAGIPNFGFGHFLLDGLARLWYAKNNPSLPILWDGKELPPYANEIFKILNLKNENIFLENPSRFSKVVFPFPGCSIGNHFDKDFGKFLGCFKPGKIKKGKKLYLSRNRLVNNVVENELQVENLFKSFGFEICYPETLTIVEQLMEISTSEIVVGVEGSALHSIVLLEEPVKTKFYAISRHRFGKGVFEHIKNAKGIDYKTLNLQLEERKLGCTSKFLVNTNLLNDLLIETSGLKIDSKLLNKITCITDTPTTSYDKFLNHFECKLDKNEQLCFDIIKKLNPLNRTWKSLPISEYFSLIRLSIDQKDDLTPSAGLNKKKWNDFVIEALIKSNAMKPLDFARVYSDLFYGKNIKTVLEIGVHKGNSIKFFREIFGVSALIYAIDIKEECLSLSDVPVDKMFIGSQVDSEFILDICNKYGPFDLVIDDGSHQNEHMIKTFDIVYPFISQDGLYVVEDMFTSYWPSYGGGFGNSATFIEMVKNKIDNMFVKFMTGKYSKKFNPDNLVERIEYVNKFDSNFTEAIQIYSCGLTVFRKIRA